MASLSCNHNQYGISQAKLPSGIPPRIWRIHSQRLPTIGEEEDEKKRRRLRILVAGGGIGGLVLALGAKSKGFDVKVFEKDLSAVRGEGKDRGPIQLLSSALAVLQVIDGRVAKQIMDSGCVTGDRINGLADGASGEWFTKFNLLTPAIERGLPVTTVICRMVLQDILVSAVGLDVVSNKSKVVGFRQDSSKVTAILEDGRQFDGDVLVGADGIRSKVRSELFGLEDANYSGLACYTGLADFVPPYIDTVGYRVFLGLNQYFVASDVGNGKMQWYAFHKEPSSSTDSSKGMKARLLELFGSWCNEVTELISETAENMILKRHIYDRDMIYTWGIGRVTLLGDAAHPMQPNLGQGGCMAIEDCYQLILELEKLNNVNGDEQSSAIVSALRRYEKKRMCRIATVHTASRMASSVLAAYQPYANLGSIPLPHFPAEPPTKCANDEAFSPSGAGNSASFAALLHELDGRGTRILVIKRTKSLRLWFEDKLESDPHDAIQMDFSELTTLRPVLTAATVNPLLKKFSLQKPLGQLWEAKRLWLLCWCP